MILRFNKKIYPENSIREAIKIFSHFQLGKFILKKDKNYFIIKVKNIPLKLKKNFSGEFSNYILSLIRNDRS